MEFEKYKKERMQRSFKNISKLVCNFSKITPRDFVESKGENVAKARHLAMYLCREYTPAESADVAKFFGVSTATVTYAIQNINKLLLDTSVSTEWIRDLA